MAGSDAYRVRLEGRADLLEATLLRLKALLPMVRSLGWRRRLRRNSALLREVTAHQQEVERALAAARRRAEAEGWPRRSPVVRLLGELDSHASRLRRATARRLGVAANEVPLPLLLERLEAAALDNPRRVLPGRRWSTALEVLPASLPELGKTGEFGDFLEALFKRPFEASGTIPVTAAEAQELFRRWPEGEESLARVWGRLEGIDRTGSLVRYLQKRARRAPLRAPRSGPERLLHAEFWHGVARSRLREIAEARLSPVKPTDAELLPLVAWLCAREEAPQALLASPALPGPRAALMELAHELWRGTKGELSGRQRAFDRLAECARRADRAESDADAERVRDTLRMFIRIRLLTPARDRHSLGTGLASNAAPLQPESLLALVSQIRALVQ